MASAVIVNLPGFPFDNFPSLGTIAALRAVSSFGLVSGENYAIDGGTTVGDGAGGVFTWVPSSLSADNGSTVVKPNNLTVGQAGRWKLIDASTGSGTGRLITPFDYGAVGDGVADDTAALGAFFAQCATGRAGDLLDKTYRFLSPFAFQGSSVSVVGSQAILLYDGASTAPGNLITFGQLGYSANDIEFLGWGIRSTKALTAGCAIKVVSAFDIRFDLDLQDVRLFDGAWFSYASLVSLLTTKLQTSNRALMWNDGVEMRCDNLYVKGNTPNGQTATIASGTSIVVGGGCGGFYDCDTTQLLANKGLVVDNSLSATQNYQIFLTGVYDTNYSVNVEINDNLGPGASKMLQVNCWAATAINGPSVHLKAWTGARALFGPSKILNCQAGPGILITDNSALVAISSGCYIARNNGFGISSVSAITLSCAATMEINSGGNFSPLVTVSGAQYGTLVTSQMPAAGWLFEATANTLTVANGASALIADGSGLITVTNPANGDVGLYLLGGGVAALVSSTLGSWVAPTTTPAGGKASVAFAAGRYSVYNNFGSSQAFAVGMLLKTRVSG